MLAVMSAASIPVMLAKAVVKGLGLKSEGSPATTSSVLTLMDGGGEGGAGGGSSGEGRHASRE
jgi:hypothetical protein